MVLNVSYLSPLSGSPVRGLVVLFPVLPDQVLVKFTANRLHARRSAVTKTLGDLHGLSCFKSWHCVGTFADASNDNAAGRRKMESFASF